MRRAAAFAVALGYAASFAVVCLAACLAAGPAEHGCCQGEEQGFRAASQDCCAVTPGVSQVRVLALVGPPSIPWTPPVAVAAGPPSPPAAIVAAKSPPPLVLRI
jgi:hypothetical protein